MINDIATPRELDQHLQVSDVRSVYFNFGIRAENEIRQALKRVGRRIYDNNSSDIVAGSKAIN
jgi:hypothetical protein